MRERSLAVLWQPLDEERRASLPIQLVVRWAVLAAALVEINVNAGATGLTYLALNGIVASGIAANALLAWRLRHPRPISTAWPLLFGLFDAAAITAGIALVDKFTNLNFILYFPAFVSFTLVFPGLAGGAYMATTMAVYVVIVTTHHNFAWDDATHVKQLVVRLVTLATAPLIANMVVRIERERRRRAVAAALAAHLEQQRVAQELHDGIAQAIYMLAVNLEANSDVVQRETRDPALHERMAALVRLAKQALLETRGLLFNLEPALTGEEGLAVLLRRQAAEFSAVTGIPVTVAASGSDPALAPGVAVELYRVTQEGLANVYKHAGATTAAIELASEDGALCLRLRDDGHGFDEASLPRRGRGLAGMRERARRLGATLTVASAPGRGTELALRLPLPARRGEGSPA
jgi:signal transduction histidine kinase